jgi:AcrR family transcriptional regulator
VRGVLDRAQLAPRYFYESFPGTDALAVAVFEQIVQEVTEAGLAAIGCPGQSLRERVHAGLDSVARLLTDDPRKGRVLLIESVASPVLAPLRNNALRLITQIVAEQAHQTLPAESADPDVLGITARFLVGGFSETLAAHIQDPASHRRETIVDHCTELFLAARRTR